jgi:RNase H-like domain found in reverse transcriptase
LWYHCSHVISPLAQLTSEKAKWAWGPKHKEAFQWIRNTIACQVLLKYPDFSKPFNIYADASDYQLGAVISQDGWPVAFYSRKLNRAQQYCHILLGATCQFFCDHKTSGFTISNLSVYVAGDPPWKNSTTPSLTIPEKTMQLRICSAAIPWFKYLPHNMRKLLPWNHPFSQQPLTKSMNLNNHSPI